MMESLGIGYGLSQGRTEGAWPGASVGTAQRPPQLEATGNGKARRYVIPAGPTQSPYPYSTNC